jgi:hypothetical protein
MALKLHFTSESYNVFRTRGRLRGKRATYNNRNDCLLFEKLASMYPEDRQCIEVIAANFMYGHSHIVYDFDRTVANYNKYIQRKQAITNVFKDDCRVIADHKIHYKFDSCDQIPDIVQLFLANKITVETMSILNDFDHIVTKARSSDQLRLLLGDDLLRVEKSTGFVKYNRNRITPVYLNFLEELYEGNHG